MKRRLRPNELRKLRKLEGLSRRAFHGLDAMKYVVACQSYRGGSGMLYVGNRLVRDILRTLDELKELRS